jgi:hypothetical protein
MTANEIAQFDTETKKMFKSCKFAAANIEEIAGSREVWGDFTSKKEATEAVKMWMTTFRNFSPKAEAAIVGKSYRVVVIF